MVLLGLALHTKEARLVEGKTAMALSLSKAMILVFKRSLIHSVHRSF